MTLDRRFAKAPDRLAELLSVPGFISRSLLQVDPVWGSLRQDGLLQTLAGEASP